MPHQAGHTWSDLFSGAGDFLKDTGLVGGTLGGLVAGLGQEAMNRQAMNRIEEMQRQAVTGVTGSPTFPTYEGGLIGEVQRQAQFKPFTVTTPTGATAAFTPEGMQAQVTPEEMGLMRSLGGFGQQAFDFLGDPAQREAEQSAVIGMLTPQAGEMAAREADIYSRLEAMQAPERERARLQLEERLAGQGRLGVRTSMFGGTPEQLALSQAIEEQRARSAVSAMEQARAEQALRSQQTLQGLGEFRERAGLFGELGLGAIAGAYLPQQQLTAALQPQLEAQRLATTLGATGLGLQAGLGEAALEAQLGYQDILGQLERQRYQGLFDLLRAERQAQQAPSVSISSQVGSTDPNVLQSTAEYLRSIGVL
jgi:hypothetical protein